MSDLDLMVRSFLERFVRIGTQPRIDGDREIEERENPPLARRRAILLKGRDIYAHLVCTSPLRGTPSQLLAPTHRHVSHGHAA